MPEKQMHPQPKADVEDESRLKAKPQPGAGVPRGDAREDEKKLKKNQEDLGVGPDHKTGDMEKHRRGTFP